MSASSLAPLAVAALAAAGAAAAALLRRSLASERAAVAARLQELAARLEAAEREIARATLAAEVAESVLLEKGLADEDDLELVRRQIEVTVGAGYHPERDGDLQ